MGNFTSTSKFNPAYSSPKVTMLSVILVLLLVMMQEVVFGQPSATFTTAGTSSYTIPAGVRKVTIETWGAGGGGGGDNEYFGTGAGGGGGGAYAKINSFTVTPLNSYTYTVGAAGSAGSSSSGNGGNGGNSSFNTTTCVAQGGTGGVGGNDGTGGAGGSTASSTGDIKYAGGSGYQGTNTPTGGGGGGSAGTGGPGNSATSGTGASAVVGGGPGGNGGNNSAGLAPASGPGGGGGGGENNGTSGRAGGAGYAGQVKISWACPSISLSSGSSTPTVCVNTAITNIVYTIGDNYVTANVTGLPTGVTSSIVGNTLTISGAPSVSSGSPYNFTITLTKPTGCDNDAVASGTITVQTISSAPTINGTYCQGGTSVSGTSSEVNGTGIIVYKAGTTQIGTASVTDGSWTATVSALAASDVLTATATASGKCVSAASSPVSVTATLTPSVSIAITSGTNPTCAGSSVTFTATPANGGTSPLYWWKINGVDAGGANTNTFTTSSLSNGQTITCVMNNIDLPCISASSATSNGITMTINPLPSFSVSKTDITCFNANNGTITITASGGSGGYQYSLTGDTYTGTYGSINEFTGLKPNIQYTIKVKDSNQCEQTNCTITNP